MILIRNGLRIKLDEENHTSSIVSSPDATGNVLIPKLVKYKDKSYPIISIKDRAFSDTKIESLMFPEDSEVTTFETFSFVYAHIKKLQIPSSLKTLQENWCYNFKDLIQIEVSPQNKNFRDYNNQYLLGKSDESSDTFDILHLSTYNITEAKIPDNIQIIKTYSLFEHDQINSIIFSENSMLRIIERKSFSSSKNIQKIVLPPNVENIDSSNFDCLDSLNDIQISEKNRFFSIFDKKYLVTKSDKNSENFDRIIFCCRDAEDAVIPSSIKEICEYSFSMCKKLRALKFDENSEVEIIGKNAFFGCVSLSEIVIPPSVNYIDDKAFYNCEKLACARFLPVDVVIPRYGLFNCVNLREISFPNAKCVDFTDDTSFYGIPNDCIVYVKNGAEIDNLDGFAGKVVYS